jgi:D-3-phosphoglycerate dehydrogenase
MKLGAILVNLARKKICDEVAVLDALNNGKLRAFLTDFPSKRLLRHPKVIATPHLGASTEEAEERSAVMAAKGLADYLQRGIVVNAVNFPTMEMPPKPSTKMRLVIPHKNVPGIIAMISEIISGAGANIGPLHNDTKNGLGCCIADLETPIDDALVEKIRAQDNILKVRTFRF